MDDFWSWPLAVLLPLLLFAMACAHELGLRVYGRLKLRADDGAGVSSDEGFILSGVLGLLALLMAFSFSMALDRLEHRRDLMLQETSAIGNLSMLSYGLPQEQGAALNTALSRYSAARLVAAQLPDGPARVAADARAVGLRATLAERVRAVLAEGQPGPLPVAIAQAFDAVEDTAVRREALASAHLPARVLWLLAVYAIISAAMLGYALAGVRARHRAASYTFYLLLTLAFGVLLDLDRPRAGGIVIDQAPFARAVEAIGEGAR